jgi:hypothetical protein
MPAPLHSLPQTRRLRWQELEWRGGSRRAQIAWPAPSLTRHRPDRRRPFSPSSLLTVLLFASLARHSHAPPCAPGVAGPGRQLNEHEFLSNSIPTERRRVPVELDSYRIQISSPSSRKSGHISSSLYLHKSLEKSHQNDRISWPEFA